MNNATRAEHTDPGFVPGSFGVYDEGSTPVSTYEDGIAKIASEVALGELTWEDLHEAVSGFAVGWGLSASTVGDEVLARVGTACTAGAQIFMVPLEDGEPSGVVVIEELGADEHPDCAYDGEPMHPGQVVGWFYDGYQSGVAFCFKHAVSGDRRYFATRSEAERFLRDVNLAECTGRTST